MMDDLKMEHCPCGHGHRVEIDHVIIGNGVLNRLSQLVAEYGAVRPFLLADCNTWQAAGARVGEILEQAHISWEKFVFQDKALEPDEKAVGSAVMHYDAGCDLIIGIGSGVINDIGKILSALTGRKYIIVATAPSMDGYASATSSMSRDGLKVSLPSRCADTILGDVDILKAAPERMLQAGLGDMLAKYISIAEWRIAHLITGEYYCENVAQMIRKAVKKCVDNAKGLLRRDDRAIEAVFEGLVIGGIAMAYAGESRPASGVEHYFSHVWDMRGLEFGTMTDLHGIQCAWGTYMAAKLYDRVRTMEPDMEKAEAYVAAFDREKWNDRLRAFLGSGAETMIALEEKEGKYHLDAHKSRAGKIRNNWQQIQRIIQEEIPPTQVLGEILDTIGIPRKPEELGFSREDLVLTFLATKDIRDKYVLSRLGWDLGVLDELCDELS